MKQQEPVWIRRAQVRVVLGLSREAVAKLIHAGALKPRVFPGMTRAYFDRREVEQLRDKESGREDTPAPRKKEDI